MEEEATTLFFCLSSSPLRPFGPPPPRTSDAHSWPSVGDCSAGRVRARGVTGGLRRRRAVSGAEATHDCATGESNAIPFRTSPERGAEFWPPIRISPGSISVASCMDWPAVAALVSVRGRVMRSCRPNGPFRALGQSFQVRPARHIGEGLVAYAPRQASSPGRCPTGYLCLAQPARPAARYGPLRNGTPFDPRVALPCVASAPDAAR